jgi:hypothetical protein
MQIHHPRAQARQRGPFLVTLNPGAGEVCPPFAIINLDPDETQTRFLIESPADCDRLIAAAAEAKRLLLGARNEVAAW